MEEWTETQWNEQWPINDEWTLHLTNEQCRTPSTDVNKWMNGLRISRNVVSTIQQQLHETSEQQSYERVALMNKYLRTMKQQQWMNNEQRKNTMNKNEQDEWTIITELYPIAN